MFSVRNFFYLKVKFLSYQTTVRELEDLKKIDWLRKSTLFKSLLSTSLLRTFTKRKVCFGETKASPNMKSFCLSVCLRHGVQMIKEDIPKVF